MFTLIEKLGQNPKNSLRLFLRGLGLFFMALLFLILGYYHHHWWQIVGLFLLIIACVLSAWGYLGIFANRWQNIIYKNRHNAKRNIW
jgi:hypothetical protein